jgi:hypothetical protein
MNTSKRKSETADVREKKKTIITAESLGNH